MLSHISTVLDKQGQRGSKPGSAGLSDSRRDGFMRRGSATSPAVHLLLERVGCARICELVPLDTFARRVLRLRTSGELGERSRGETYGPCEIRGPWAGRYRCRTGGVVSEQEPEETLRLMFPEGVGMVVALLDAGVLDRRRSIVLHRLRRLQDTEEFAMLPEDLRERVRAIVADADR